MATIFVSPGVYTKEQDFTVFASRIGITRLGLVGKTEKGPAFEAVKVTSADEYLLRFGGTKPELPLSYVANSFLSQSNDLTISRVLGKGGFTNSPAWLIKAETGSTAVGLYNNSVALSGVTVGISGTTYDSNAIHMYLYTGFTFDVQGWSWGRYIDIYINPLSSVTSNRIADYLNANSNYVFQYFSYTSIFATGSGSSPFPVPDNGWYDSGYIFSAGTPQPGGGPALCILRSKQADGGTIFFDQQTDVKIGVSTMASPLDSFVLSATTGPLTAYTANGGLSVSLDETKDNYIVKVLGKNPKEIAGKLNLYVEEIYPHYVREAEKRNVIGTKLSSVLEYKTTADYTLYTDDYTHSVTPWIVSRVVGGEVHRLFKFHTISDGDASAREIKISIANLDVVNYTFDVIVRRFEDTDATASQTALERFSNVTLDETKSNFIGKYIGTFNEEYPSKSMFITVELAQSYPDNSLPSGFEGYTLKGAQVPDMYYKTTYLSGDSTFKTYLGLSELGYTNLTPAVLGSVRNSVKSLDADLFAYHGYVGTGMTITTTKGFHMENTAPADSFYSGDKSALELYKRNGTSIIDKTKLKFTVVPAGGFDGFNKYKTYLNSCDEFIVNTGNTNSVQFQEAIDVLKNPEEVDINLLATPGIDFHNNEDLVKYALDMTETRGDALYIMEAPRLTETIDGETQKGTPEEVVDILESTGIDSNYAATYWPWIQIEDSISGKYTYQPPTLMVVKTLALTDNVAAPWFAPAGINRATAGTGVKRTDIKLSTADRDTLYGGRVNPIASFVQQGIVIWGQKTLQVNQSALDRINIRRLLLQVRRLVSAAALTLLFEQNDQTLRDQFLAKVEPILLQIKNQRGLTDFKVVMDDSNNTADTIDRNMLIGKIQLKPTRTAEFIDLTFQVLPTGANFENF